MHSVYLLYRFANDYAEFLYTISVPTPALLNCSHCPAFYDVTFHSTLSYVLFYLVLKLFSLHNRGKCSRFFNTHNVPFFLWTVYLKSGLGVKSDSKYKMK